MARIDLKNAIIYLEDSNGLSLEVKIGEGNLTYTETKNREYRLNRGILDDVVNADEAPMDVNFQFVWVYRKSPSSSSTASGGTPTIDDVLKQQGAAANWVSTDADLCRPYAVDIKIVYTPDCSTGDVETIVLPDFRYETLNSDIGGSAVDCTGKCNATEPTNVRTAQ